MLRSTRTNKTTAAMLLIAMGLTACGNGETETATAETAETQTTPTTATAETPTPAPMQAPSPEELKQIVTSIETAMAEIPPELRESFQKAFVCYNQREEAKARESGKPRPPLTGDDIRAITKQLQSGDKSLLNC